MSELKCRYCGEELREGQTGTCHANPQTGGYHQAIPDGKHCIYCYAEFPQYVLDIQGIWPGCPWSTSGNEHRLS